MITHEQLLRRAEAAIRHIEQIEARQIIAHKAMLAAIDALVAVIDTIPGARPTIFTEDPK